MGHLHKGWCILVMECDGSAASDGFLVFMSEYLGCVCIYASSGTDALMPMKVVPYYWVRKGRGRTDGASGEAN